MSETSTNFVASVFESFNARSLAPEQVAKRFIPPKLFQELASRCHSQVIGPRGSGKTSLLKMLQPSALEAWDSPEADDYRKRIDYTGIFVPTDITWNRQTVAIVEGLPDKIAMAFRGAAFTTHVLHELLDVMVWRTAPSPTGRAFRRIELSRETEKSIVAALALSWNLTPLTHTLLGLKQSLADRLVQIWSIAQRITLLGASLDIIPTWITLDFLSCSKQAMELFDDAIGKPTDRWALLFDELELAPDWLMQGLLTALRSTSEKILFKLAVSPFNEHYDLLGTARDAMPGHDFNEILLWHPHKEAGFDFSKRLFLSVCEDLEVSAKEVSDVVGESFLDADSDSMPYQKGSQQYRVLKKGIESDPSFARFWQQQNVDIEKISELDEAERAAKVRKIYPIVVIRNFFRVPANSRQATKQIRQSRKSMQIYSGASAILTIAEANPRWIIGLTRLLLAGSPRLPIPRHTQAQQIENTLHKFRARLKTISLGISLGRGKSGTLLDFLDQIGTYFQQSVIIDDFHPQPTLSITVDSNTPSHYLAAIGKALNAGALVFVPDKASIGVLSDPKGKRFRLSYLLAPYYRLPLRLGNSAPLSAVMRERKITDPEQVEMTLP